MSDVPFRLYCTKQTKTDFENIRRVLQAQKNKDFTQDDCLRFLCDYYLKDHLIKPIPEVTSVDPVH